jgi:hypothetical protein
VGNFLGLWVWPRFLARMLWGFFPPFWWAEAADCSDFLGGFSIAAKCAMRRRRFWAVIFDYYLGILSGFASAERKMPRVYSSVRS